MRTLIVVVVAALVWWLRREREQRKMFERGTLAELDGYVDNVYSALLDGNDVRIGELLVDMHRIIEAERDR